MIRSIAAIILISTPTILQGGKINFLAFADANNDSRCVSLTDGWVDCSNPKSDVCGYEWKEVKRISQRIHHEHFYCPTDIGYLTQQDGSIAFSKEKKAESEWYIVMTAAKTSIRNAVTNDCLGFEGKSFTITQCEEELWKVGYSMRKK